MYIFTLWVHLNSNFNSHTDRLADTSSEPPGRTRWALTSRCALTSACLLLPHRLPLNQPKLSLLTPQSHHIQSNADPFGSICNTCSIKSCSLLNSATPASRWFYGRASTSGLAASTCCSVHPRPSHQRPRKSGDSVHPPLNPFSGYSPHISQSHQPPCRSSKHQHHQRSPAGTSACTTLP